MNFSTGSAKVVMNSVLITTATMQPGRNPLDAKGQHILYQSTISSWNPNLYKNCVTFWRVPFYFSRLSFSSGSMQSSCRQIYFFFLFPKEKAELWKRTPCFPNNPDLSDIRFLVILSVPFSSLSFIAFPTLFLEIQDWSKFCECAQLLVFPAVQRGKYDDMD